MFENKSREPFLEQHKGVRVFLLSLLLFLTVIIGLGTYAAAKLNVPYSENAPSVTVTVAKGASSSQVARSLEQKKVISNDRVFLYYLFAKGAINKIQAGNYELSGAMTIPEIVQKLTHGEVISNEVRVRIGEGWNLSQIAAAVEESGLGTKDSFHKLTGSPPALGGSAALGTILSRYEFLDNLPAGTTLEGYLFPDTYFISREGGAEELVHKALQNFDKQVSSDLRFKISAQNKTLHQVITIASLIEAEVGRNVVGRKLTESEIKEIEEERFIVADIFWTRLGLGLPLESDATVGYATGKPRRQATIEDTKINSLYNTYRYAGLPPGPINSPSLAAIDATLNPANTPYLFFLSAPDGKAYFARTLEEHNANRRKYLSE